MSSSIKAVTFLILVLFNIVGASFPPLPDSKYTELPFYTSDSERPSDDNESWDGIESLSSDEEDFGNDNYDFINDYDSNTVEESVDSRQANENLIVPFEPVKFFDDSEDNSHIMIIKSDDNTQTEEKAVNDGVQVNVIKPKKFSCDCNENCVDCCNLS